jgi:hypothetical protein
LFLFTTVCTSLVLHEHTQDSFELHQHVDVEDVRQIQYTVLKDGMEQKRHPDISPSQLIDWFNDYPPTAIRVIPESELLPPTVKIRIDLHENGHFIELCAYQERYWVIRSDVADGAMYTLEEETPLTDFIDSLRKLHE